MCTIKRKFPAVMRGFLFVFLYFPSKQRLLTARLITGLSMGGHGAMYIAARHPELYAAAGSKSGVMNIHTKTWKGPEAFAKSRAENFARLPGPPKNKLNYYTDYTSVSIADKLKTAAVKLICDV